MGLRIWKIGESLGLEIFIMDISEISEGEEGKRERGLRGRFGILIFKD